MSGFKVFSWDESPCYGDEETELKDPAYAGDKEPDSEDDKPCGDGFIPSDKDCHDGDAHDPEPGENPYWTDENSAEKRNERGVDWDDNKPSEPAEEPEQPKLKPEQIESVPSTQWAKDVDRVRSGVIGLTALMTETGQEERAREMMNLLPYLRDEDRKYNLQGMQGLKDSIGAAEEALIKNPNADPNGVYNESLAKAKFAIESMEASMRPQDPRQIMAWNKLMNSPETLEVDDILQLTNLKKVDIHSNEELSPGEQKYVQAQIRKIETALMKWREAPTLSGAYLAEQFYKEPRLLGKSVDESPFETNPQLAQAILNRSARAGDHLSNKALWENFGMSEEWHPSSFLFDNQKAISKATRELESMADWSEVDRYDREMMLAGVEMAEAEEELEELRPKYEELVEKIKAKRDAGKINPNTFKRQLAAASKMLEPAEDKLWDAKKAMREASAKTHEAAEKLRQPIMDALKKMNANTQVDADTAGELLYAAGNVQWAEIDEDSDDYKKPAGPEGLSGQRLKTLRRDNRGEDASYPSKEKIVSHLQDFFSMCHGDLLGAPELKDLKWTSEIYERAYADPNKNTICLNVHPPKQKKGNIYEVERKKKENALDRPDVAIHEFAHHLEFRNPDVANRVLDFYDRRTQGGKIINKHDIDPQTGQPYAELSHYEDYEQFKDDHFFNMYCGKFYGDRHTYKSMGKDGHPSTELLSMGVQALYNKAMWGSLVQQDRQHLALIVATLRGY